MLRMLCVSYECNCSSLVSVILYCFAYIHVHVLIIIIFLVIVRYIYWTDIGKDYYGVEEAAKDGTHRRKIPCTDTCYIPGPITVDPATGDVYFAVEDKDHLFYYTPTPNHTDVVRTSSIQVEGHKVSSLTILNNEVYWTDKKNGRLFKEDLSPSNGIKEGELVAEGVGHILAVTSVDNTLPISKSSWMK